VNEAKQDDENDDEDNRRGERPAFLQLGGIRVFMPFGGHGRSPVVRMGTRKIYHEGPSLTSISAKPYNPAMSEGSVKIIAQNKKARFNYSIEESLECGIALEGTEVKSVKAGNVSFPDSFAEIRSGEVFLIGFHITPYVYSSIFNHDPDRPKKLLLHRTRSSALSGRLMKRALPSSLSSSI
jgi:hypothetical protein